MGLCLRHVWYHVVDNRTHEAENFDAKEWVRGFVARALQGSATEISQWQPFFPSQEHREKQHVLVLLIGDGSAISNEYLILCNALALHNAGRLLVIPVFAGGIISANIWGEKQQALLQHFQSLPTAIVRTEPLSVPVQIKHLFTTVAGTNEVAKPSGGGRPIIDVFSSYAHEDEELRDELDKHLKALERSGLIRSWNDRRIEPGSEWERVLNENLHTADILLLLISPDFFASDYCYEVELPIAFERHRKQSARAVPVILRPVVWQVAELGKLQALPKDAKPVILWPSRDAAFVNICEGILQLIVEWKGGAPAEPSPPAAQTALRRRTLDAALPNRIVRGRSVVLACMIRRNSSPGLKALVEANVTYGIRSDEVQSSPVKLSFPVNPETRKLEPLEVQVSVETPDFLPNVQTRNLIIPPFADSEPCIFLLAAEKTGNLKIVLTVHDNTQTLATVLLGAIATVEDELLARPSPNFVSEEFELAHDELSRQRERLALEVLESARLLVDKEHYEEALSVLAEDAKNFPSDSELSARLEDLRRSQREQALPDAMPIPVPAAPAPSRPSSIPSSPESSTFLRRAWVSGALAAVLIIGFTTITFRSMKAPVSMENAPVSSENAAVPVTIDTVPSGAEIRIDGEVRGTAPLQISLPAGSYTIHAKLPEYDDHEQTIEVSKAAPSFQLNLSPVKKEVRPK